MSAEPIGYRRPPVEHRFKKGRSGNPKGRPKRRKTPSLAMPDDFAELVLAAAGRTVPIVENGRTIELPMIEAILRRLSVSAAKGDNRATALMLGLLEAALETAKLNRTREPEPAPNFDNLSPQQAAETYLRFIRGA